MRENRHHRPLGIKSNTIQNTHRWQNIVPFAALCVPDNDDGNANRLKREQKTLKRRKERILYLTTNVCKQFRRKQPNSEILKRRRREQERERAGAKDSEKGNGEKV